MDESSMSFSNFGLPKEINGAIKDLGYKAPTPIQAQTLPHSLNGEDIIGQAQTGTGKTAAFLISILTYELENPPEEDRPPGSPFALIIAPARNLVFLLASLQLPAEKKHRFRKLKKWIFLPNPLDQFVLFCARSLRDPRAD